MEYSFPPTQWGREEHAASCVIPEFLDSSISCFSSARTQGDGLTVCGGGRLRPLVCAVPPSAQMSHRRCNWAAEVDLCGRGMMWLYFTDLLSSSQEKSTLFRPPQQHGAPIRNSRRWLTPKYLNTEILTYQETWSGKLRCNQLAGNNALMKRFQTGR